MSRIDAVLSVHTNPHTCGVAKFSQQLARRLRVPLDGYWKHEHPYAHPIFSVKFAEIRPLEPWLPGRKAYDLFMHDLPLFDSEWRMVMNAVRVYAGSRYIAARVRDYRPDVIEAFCPSTVDGNPHRGAYKVLAFGMAHKLALTKFQELKQQLEIEHPDYTVSLSTAVHEGNPWDQALTESIDAMRGIFGDKLRVLGYLGDDALAKELQDCDAVAVYFDPAVRENNTTVWAALSAGKTVYTNTDEHSPPLDPNRYSWEALTRLMV